MRGVLEQLAGELAAGKFGGKEALLQRQADKVSRAYEKRNMEEYARQDLAFHRMIVEAAGSQVLLENWDALHFDIRTRLYLGQSTPSLYSTLDLHDEIVQALIQGKGKLAGRLLRRHSEALLRWERRTNRHSRHIAPGVGNPKATVHFRLARRSSTDRT